MLPVFHRVEGFQDDTNHTSTSLLYAFVNEKPQAAASYTTHVAFLHLRAREPDVSLDLGCVPEQVCRLIAETSAELACVKERVRIGMVMSQRRQRKPDGFRYILSVHADNVSMIQAKLRSLGVATYGICEDSDVSSMFFYST